MTRNSRVFALAVATVVAMAIGATTASAADYCVGESAGSVACPLGSQDFTFDQTGLQSALSLAANAGSSPGHDRVFIASGTISVSTMVSISPNTGESFELIGEGGGLSRIAVAAGSAQGLLLNFSNVPTSEVKGLAFDVPGQAGLSVYGMRFIGSGKVRNCEFVVAGNGGNTDYGIEGSAQIEVRDSTFTLTGSAAYAIYGTGTLDVFGSTFVGDPAGNTTAIQASGNATRTVHGSTFRNLYRGVSFDQGIVNVFDSLFGVGSQNNAVGIYAGNANNSSGIMSLGVDGASFIGSGTGQIGVHLEAGTTNPAGETMNAIISNSLFRMPTTEVRCKEDNDGATVFGTVTLDIDHTLLDPTKYATLGSGSCAKSETAMLDGSVVTPLFVDAAGGNYRPANGSPVIDAGDPATTTTNRATDAGGSTRFVDADGDGNSAVDVGAFEYQQAAPTAPVITASTLAPQIGQSVDFGASSTDENGDTLTYDWTFGDGAVATGAAVSHAFGTVGPFTVTVTVSDGTGLTNQQTVAIEVQAAPVDPIVPSMTLGRATGKFKRANKSFAVVSSTRRPHIPARANVEVEVVITLARTRGGYRSGSRCVKRKPASGTAKRCSLKLRGSQTLKLPAGDSAIVFGGKWRGKRLATGRYDVLAVARGTKDGKRAVLNVIR